MLSVCLSVHTELKNWRTVFHRVSLWRILRKVESFRSSFRSDNFNDHFAGGPVCGFAQITSVTRWVFVEKCWGQNLRRQVHFAPKFYGFRDNQCSGQGKYSQAPSANVGEIPSEGESYIQFLSCSMIAPLLGYGGKLDHLVSNHTGCLPTKEF